MTGYSIEETYDLRMFFDGKAPWGYKNDALLTQAKKLDRLYKAEEYKNIYNEQ